MLPNLHFNPVEDRLFAINGPTFRVAVHPKIHSLGEEISVGTLGNLGNSLTIRIAIPKIVLFNIIKMYSEEFEV